MKHLTRRIIFFGTLFIILYLFILFFSYVSDVTMFGLFQSENKILLYIFDLWLILISLTYIFLFFWIKDKKITNHQFKVVILFTVVFSLILIFAQPTSSIDIFHNFYKVKSFSFYGLNPFAVSTTIDCQNSPSTYTCVNEQMTYGPLWLLISILPGFITSYTLVASIFLFKIFLAIVNFALIFLVYKILEKIADSYKYFGTFLFAWNPLILFETINNGHNDIVMIFFLVLAVYFFIVEKKMLVLPMVVLSILIKYITFIFFPIFYILLLRKYPSIKEKIYFTIKNVILVFGLLILFFLPFWNGFSIFKDIIYFSQGFIWKFNISLVPVLIFSIILLFNTLINIKFDSDMLLLFSKQLSILIYLLIYLFTITKLFLKKNISLIKTLVVFAVVFLIFSVKIHPWYFIWIGPLLILESKKNSYMIFVILTAIFFAGYTLTFTYISMFLLLILPGIIILRKYWVKDNNGKLNHA